MAAPFNRNRQLSTFIIPMHTRFEFTKWLDLFQNPTSHVKLHWNPELSVLIQSIVAYLRLYETRKLVSYDNKHSLPTYLVNTNRHNIDTLFSVERIKGQQ